MPAAESRRRIDQFSAYVRATHQRKAIFFGCCYSVCWLAGIVWPSVLVIAWVLGLAFFVPFAIEFWREFRDRWRKLF